MEENKQPVNKMFLLLGIVAGVGVALGGTGLTIGLIELNKANILTAQVDEITQPTTTYYTATFRNYDGTFISSSEIAKGAKATAPTNNPTRAEDNDATYAFNAWSPVVADTVINSDTTFFATYSKTDKVKNYNVTFNNYDGTYLASQIVASGSKATAPETNPTKEEDATSTYTFKAWSPSITDTVISKDTTFFATYNTVAKTKSFTVSFCNYDGTFISSSSVDAGNKATAPETNPTRAEDSESTYTFKEWSPSIGDTIINRDTTFFAIYTSNTKTKKYQATFRNYDGTLLEIQSVDAGSTATELQTAPTREKGNGYSYAFSKWSPEITTVINEDTSFIAQYAATPISSYTVTFLNADGSALSTQKVYEGEKPIVPGVNPTKDDEGGYCYSFSAWNNDVTKGITHDTTFTPLFVKVFRELTTGVALSTYDVSGVDNYRIDSYSGSASTIYIPAEKDGIPISSIDVHVFRDCLFSSIIFENDSSITEIPEECFKNCSNLSTVVLPDGITTLGTNCFSQTGIESFTLSSNITSLGSGAFQSCLNLTSFAIEDGSSITAIPSNCFLNCSSLTCVSLPSTVITLDYSCFYGSGISSISPFSHITSFGNYCFAGTKITFLEDMYFASGATLGNHLFANCKNLTNVMFQHGQITSIPNYCFENCPIISANLELITSIGEYAFSGCEKLTNVSFSPNTILTSIGEGAFQNCHCFNATIIADTIGDGAFGGMNFSGGTLTVSENVETYGKYAFSQRYSSVDADFENITLAFQEKIFGTTAPANHTSLGDCCMKGLHFTNANLAFPTWIVSYGASCFENCYFNNVSFTFAAGNDTSFGWDVFANAHIKKMSFDSTLSYVKDSGLTVRCMNSFFIDEVHFDGSRVDLVAILKTRADSGNAQHIFNPDQKITFSNGDADTTYASIYVDMIA